MRNFCLTLFTLVGLVCGIALFGNTSIPILNGSISQSTHVVVTGQWPPKPRERYPDLRLTDQNGDPCQLSEFAGKIILLELAAVPCKGCQAFAGGKKHGGFAGVCVQPGLDSIHDYANRFASVKLGENDQVVLVQLLLYGKSMSSPTAEEVNGWAKHFEMERGDNEVVLRGDPSLLSPMTRKMIPGFHLIDKDFLLTCDSSGHHPTQDLYRDLLPMLGELSRE